MLRIVIPYGVAIVAACVVLDFAITRWVALSDPEIGSARIHRLVSAGVTDEIPLLGSSRANSNYAVESLDPRIHNYGIKGAGFEAVAFQLEKALERETDRPILVNVDLGWWSMKGAGDLAMYVPSSHDPAVRELLESDLRFYHRLPFVRYFGLYQRYWTERLDEWGRLIAEGRGFHETSEGLSRAAEALRSWAPDHAPDSLQLARLLSLLDEHPDRSIIFVVAPYHASYFQIARHADAADGWLAELDRRPNATVVDFSRAVYPDSLYTDPVHLNWNGARRFSEDLRAEIADLIGS
ncbi:MAG TPA: hypothetical protein VF190_04990 [Rhodothermales bacterium]